MSHTLYGPALADVHLSMYSANTGRPVLTTGHHCNTVLCRTGPAHAIVGVCMYTCVQRRADHFGMEEIGGGTLRRV
jgi:hypothetical protein